ncbi:MAG: 4Fe-4S binding protein [Candidatus Hadarchaeales archaeon]
MVEISCEIHGIKLRNPIIAAAGVTTRDGECIERAAAGGAAAAVTKTVSSTPAKAPHPFMAKVREGIISFDMISDISVEQWVKYEMPKAKRSGIPVIASVGPTPEDVRKVAPRLVEAGADGIEVPVPSDPQVASEMVKSARESVEKPVFAKIMEPLGTLESLARELESSGADGIVVAGPIGPGLSIDVESSMPVLGAPGGAGYVSGPPVKPIMLKRVADVSRSVNIPVIGCGGVYSGRDIVEYVMAGASAVQVSTAAILRGYKVYGFLADELVKFMRAKNYETLADMRGKALHHLPQEPLRTSPAPVELIASKCTACGLCESSCPYGGIRIIGRLARVDSVKCCGCGLCVSICPTHAIRF